MLRILSQGLLANWAALSLVDYDDATIDTIPAYEMSLFAGLSAFHVFLFPFHVADSFSHCGLLPVLGA
jgi:hypothetical protein